MLQFIRDRAQGFVVGVIVLFICLTFALWGVEEYLGAGSTPVVAEVNGDEVELPEFQRAFQRLRQQAQVLFGEQFDPTEWSGQTAKLSTLDQVVEEHVLLQLAEDANIRVSDQQIARQIQSSEEFYDENGNFSAEKYSTLVNYMGFSEIGFEHQMRRDVILNQLRSGVAGTAFVTNREARLIEQLRQQKRDVGYVVIGIEGFISGEAPQESDIAKFYEENAEDYRTEEKADLELVRLSIETLMKEVAPSEQALVEYYEQNSGNYTQEERRNANHILVQASRSVSEEADATALAKATALRELAISADKSFEDIATENSDDIGSKAEGGETGLFGKGVMAPEFEDAVFSMAIGDVSQPIRTDFGYHIIRLKEIEAGGLQSFDEARTDVEDQYRREQAEAIYFEQAEQLSNLAYEHPDTLDIVSEELGLAIEKTGLLSRDEIELRLSAKAVEAAFNPETLVEGLNTEPLEVTSGALVVIRVAEYEPSRIPSLDEVKARVIDDFKLQAAKVAIVSHGEALIEKLRGGEDPVALFAAQDLEWKEESAQGQNSPKLSRAISRAAFSLPVPVGEDAVTGIAMGSGDYAVIRVSKVDIPEAGEILKSDMQDVRNTLTRGRVISDWRQFVGALRENADITLYPERL